MQLCSTNPQYQFDKKFKIILRTKCTIDYFERLDWVNNHSNGDVEVRVLEVTHSLEDDEVLFAFSDPDDALVFKIKYSI